MTKKELESKILLGTPLDKCFSFTAGQECEIFKANRFEVSDEIIYIPDLYLNELSEYVTYYSPIDALEVAQNVLDCCYTGKDFLELCSGDLQKAEMLFDYCDWQHPSSALPEIEDEDESEMPYLTVRISGDGYLTVDGEVAVFRNESQARCYMERLKKHNVRVRCEAFRYSIGTCKRCGSPLFPSDLPTRGYESQCLTCDEDFYSFEQETSDA